MDALDYSLALGWLLVGVVAAFLIAAFEADRREALREMLWVFSMPCSASLILMLVAIVSGKLAG